MGDEVSTGELGESPEGMIGAAESEARPVLRGEGEVEEGDSMTLSTRQK